MRTPTGNLTTLDFSPFSERLQGRADSRVYFSRDDIPSVSQARSSLRERSTNSVGNIHRLVLLTLFDKRVKSDPIICSVISMTCLSTIMVGK